MLHSVLPVVPVYQCHKSDGSTEEHDHLSVSWSGLTYPKCQLWSRSLQPSLITCTSMKCHMGRNSRNLIASGLPTPSSIGPSSVSPPSHCIHTHAHMLPGKPLTESIRHYEALSYDTGPVRTQHERLKRGVTSSSHLQVSFHAFDRFVNTVTFNSSNL